MIVLYVLECIVIVAGRKHSIILPTMTGPPTQITLAFFV